MTQQPSFVSTLHNLS